MTTPTAPCPACGSSERVDVIEPPAHDPDARFYCAKDNLAFRGSPEEAEAMRKARADKARDRDDMHRRADTGRALGVIGDQP